MHRVYEVFEVSPDGSPQKVTVVSGLEFAKLALEGLSKRTNNECFCADARTHQIVLQANVPPLKWRAIKPVFQIAYDEEMALQRTKLLEASGHAAMSVIGNQAAKLLLSSFRDYDLFIVSNAAPEETRGEMVVWLKDHYHTVKVLAINPGNEQILGADYNVREDEPERWIRIVNQKFAPRNGGLALGRA